MFLQRDSVVVQPKLFMKKEEKIRKGRKEDSKSELARKKEIFHLNASVWRQF